MLRTNQQCRSRSQECFLQKPKTSQGQATKGGCHSACRGLQCKYWQRQHRNLIMVKHGLGEINENAEHFATFCTFNSLVIGGSVFPHSRVLKATWVSPDHRTEKQIDHICISQKFKRSLLDVRGKRGADVAEQFRIIDGKGWRCSWRRQRSRLVGKQDSIKNGS